MVNQKGTRGYTALSSC